MDNVQNGEDNCANYYVDKEDLLKLKKLCEQVLKDKSKASELLPTQSGFLFGGTEYDEYYIKDLTITLGIIEKCLKLGDGYVFGYHSSW